MDIQFQFALEAKVTIVPSNVEGMVIGNFIDRDSIKWAYVRYVTTAGELRESYIRETELTV